MYNPIRKYQQGGQADPEQLMQQIAQMLQQQIPPQQIMQQLQKMGIQPEQAQQMIQQVAQSIQQAPEQPQMQQGGSIVDFLANKGQKFDFASRKELAKNMGVSDYKGTAEQNLRLLSYLDDSPFNTPQLPKEFNQFVESSKKNPQSNYEYKSFNSPSQINQTASPNLENSNAMVIGAAGAGAALGAGAYGLNELQNFLTNSPEYIKGFQKNKNYQEAEEALISKAFKNSKYKPRFIINSEGKPLLKGMVEASMFNTPSRISVVQPNQFSPVIKQGNVSVQLPKNYQKATSVYSEIPSAVEAAQTISNPYTTVQLPKGVAIPENISKLKQGWNAAKEVLAGSKFLKNAKNLLRFEEGGEFNYDYNPYLSKYNEDDQIMMQQGGKINYADFPPERTIVKREELYKGANPNILVYQDTYGNGRKDITYQDRKTGKMMSNPWATNKDSSINRSVTGSLDLQNPKFVPIQSVSKMKKGGMKKWSY
jgi:hypothetical protein